MQTDLGKIGNIYRKAVVEFIGEILTGSLKCCNKGGEKPVTNST